MKEYGLNWRRVVGAIGNRLVPLNSDRLCMKARRRTGLSDFGQPELQIPLRILVASLEAEAGLHPLGRLLMRLHLAQLLETRLRVAASWRERPANNRRSPIDRPVFIVGMPRSGSTFLHELLAQDPRNRAPRVWEVMFPLAAARGDKRNQLRSIRKTEGCLWWFRKLAPQADAVYPMRASTPHECVAIHSYTLFSEEFVSTCRIPAYEKFLRSSDRTPVYEWEKQFLQMLQNESQPKRWVLKSPDHVHSLEQLFSVFPDAFVIQTHRNPFQVLRSSAQLTGVLHGLYAWAGDPKEIAAHEMKVLGESTERFMRFRDEHPELAERFIDLKYSDLVTEPLKAVSRIYQRLNCDLGAEAAERMRQLASERSRYGGVRASNTEPVRQKNTIPEESRLEEYCYRFGLPTTRFEPSR